MNYKNLHPKLALLFTVFLCLNVAILTAQDKNAKKATELPDKGVPLAVNSFPIASKTYTNKGKITSIGKVEEHQNVVFKSEYAIELNPGFETIEGAKFEAYIEVPTTSLVSKKDNNKLLNAVALSLSPNPVYENLTLLVQSDTEGNADIEICNTQGSIVITKSAKLFKGTQQIVVDCNTMPNGLYVVLININGIKKSEKFIVNR
jgi:uncharacterized membrane protein